MLAVISLKHEGLCGGNLNGARSILLARTPFAAHLPTDTVVIDGVPQLIYKLPFDKTVSPEIAPLDIASVLDRVIIGPTQYAGAMRRAFVSALQVAWA